jgi:exosome complex component RRP42
MDARITITTNSNSEFVAIQKGVSGTFTLEEIKKISKIARIKGEEIRSKIRETVNYGE